MTGDTAGSRQNSDNGHLNTAPALARVGFRTGLSINLYVVVVAAGIVLLLVYLRKEKYACVEVLNPQSTQLDPNLRARAPRFNSSRF